MQGFVKSRGKVLSAVAAFILVVGGFATAVVTRSTSAAPAYFTLAGSYTAPGNSALLGSHTSTSQMTISLTLKPNHASDLNTLLANLYDPNSKQYHQWLSTGQFAEMFGPTSAQIAQAVQFLQGKGLKVSPSTNPFVVRATGSQAQIESAFQVHEKDYRAANGQHFFQNDSAVKLPANLSAIVDGVVGLTDTVRLGSNAIPTSAAAKAAGTSIPQYGAAPGGAGLTPSQWTSLYSAKDVYSTGNSGKGAGANLAVFELSGYTAADIQTYAQTFFGASASVPLVDVNVDGGPVTPACPSGDYCGPFDVSGTDASGCPLIPGTPFGACDSADYSGDIEVQADLEAQYGTAPKASHLLVYNAPNDWTGQTVIDEYFQIAFDNTADSISSSWGLCEQDESLSQIGSENVAFEIMAAQGQSMFTSSGDTGAYGCLRGDGSTVIMTGDPASQPWVSGVGGTSFGTYDPQTSKNPTYPTNAETVWNPLGRCRVLASGAVSSYCSTFGAGGGAPSVIWARPSYQSGIPGLNSSYETHGPSCLTAANGKPCRETPDISANADEFTPYGEYCTGAVTVSGPGASTCASENAFDYVYGWFGIGGTSLSSPVWSAIVGLYDSVHHARFGNANEGLYQLASKNYSKYFHDITGKNQFPDTNGYFPTTNGYDMATGIGSPLISAIAEAKL